MAEADALDTSCIGAIHRDDSDWLALTAEPIQETEVRKWLTHPACGAVVIFAGTVRVNSPGHQDVRSIRYEVHHSLAMRQLSEIATATHARWSDAVKVSMLHRFGDVPLGATSVLVGCAAPHRATAFAAAEFMIDLIKQVMPVWKLEHSASATAWSACTTDIVPVSTAVGSWRRRCPNGETVAI
ncbi:hypothetical protein BVC93_27600 [Mycobacterium sp. MS1601]|uniref:molybdenum cofactor biosynthesis protein MoaE n=1 Tax=Mycobacterium sp. MS1601 TaxID=1936029 RepID=UPI0009790F04|nr:hypothetical protein BVC93_27600 [Mycobacterium sp. MS1601]